MPREIDRKLQLTAVALGLGTRKALAAAFRDANPDTVFDVARAHKWLQGRAQPREPQLYGDWLKVLGLDREPAWLAECPVEELAEAIAARRGDDAGALLRRAAAGSRQGRPEPAAASADGVELAGCYVTYSHAWSPYFAGRVIRGELVLEGAGERLAARYGETLPTGRMELAGGLTLGDRMAYLAIGRIDRQPRLDFCLFRPTPPASLLAGVMLGTPFHGPDPEPATTRIVMVRLPEASPRLRDADAYLPAGASLAADLAALGMAMADPAGVDALLGEFLQPPAGGRGVDRLPAALYRRLVARFDARWLQGAPPEPPALRLVRSE